MNIAIVGLGLIGGSLARTIKLHTTDTVYAVDIDPVTMEEALAFKAYDEPLTDDRLEACDLIFVALYPERIVRWIRENAQHFKPGAVVIDCGGVKQYICDEIMPLAKNADWTFIGGHPMAGREFSGFRYAKDDMFDRASMILVPDEAEDPVLLQKVRGYFLDLGFRRVQFTTAVTHDEMIAYTSQLAHIVSSAYVKCPLAEKHRGFSAGSFADMTRVARLNEDMWTELFFENREALLPEVEGLAERVAEYARALRENDRQAMHDLLREGRETKERLTE